MSYLLCIETSTTNCSVSISKNDEIIVLKEDNSLNYSHAESLHLFINKILKSISLQIRQIDAIVVSKGPGSYTGLRIGVSAAKGLCYALDIPLISVNTLESLANQVKSINQSYIVPMLDARRMEVYTAIFDSEYKNIKITEALILNEDSYQDLLSKQQTIFIGSGVPKFKEICNHKNALFIENKLPSANELVSLGYQKFTKKEFDDIVYFEPYYLKDFIAGKPKKK